MEPEQGTVGESSAKSELKRSERKKTKETPKLPIIIAATLALTAILALGAFFIFKPFSITRLIDTYTLGADVDAQMDYLLDNTPELFTEAYGGHGAEELRERIASAHKDRNLLAKEARRRGIADVTDKVDASLKALKSGYIGTQEFQRMLDQRGITEKQLRATLEANILIAELAKDLVKESDITDVEARTYFNANSARYSTSASKKVSHILFAASDSGLATSVHAQITEGGDFAALAKEHSKDSGSAARGGDIGWSTSTYPETFQQAVDALGAGEVSVPVATRYGIHIIKVSEVRDSTSSFEAVKEQVTSDLLGKKRAEAIEALLKELKG